MKKILFKFMEVAIPHSLPHMRVGILFSSPSTHQRIMECLFHCLGGEMGPDGGAITSLRPVLNPSNPLTSGG